MKLSIQSIYSVIVTICLAAVLFSCSTFNAPTVEHFFSNVQKLKTAYCSETAAPVREAILAKIRESHPEYPEHGFCGMLAPIVTPAA